MLKKIIAIALVGTALGETCATFEELSASNGEEFEIKYSTENREMTPADGKNLGFKQEKKDDGKNLDYGVLGDYSENEIFKVKGDEDKKGFRIWSKDETTIFSYNQGSAFSIKGGYYMWKVDETDALNDSHKLKTPVQVNAIGFWRNNWNVVRQLLMYTSFPVAIFVSPFAIDRFFGTNDYLETTLEKGPYFEIVCAASIIVFLIVIFNTIIKQPLCILRQLATGRSDPTLAEQLPQRLYQDDYYTRFIFDDKTQSLKTKTPSFFADEELAITEGNTGTQIYQKKLYNGMMKKNTRFCFIAKKHAIATIKGTNNGTNEPAELKVDIDVDSSKSPASVDVRVESSAVSVGVLVGLISLCIVN